MIELQQKKEIAQRSHVGSRKGGSRLVFGVAIFTSAFLLFQVQLMLGKFLLPWFGGTSAVWATCLLFFQVVLFGGYFYSHKISQFMTLQRQGSVHLVVLASAGLLLVSVWIFWGSPILPNAAWKPLPGSAPVLGILKLLVLAVGVPFLVLSSTGPLLQKWYYEIQIDGRTSPPYFLYALSNAGSLIGLLSYPIVMEPLVGLDTQSRIWGWVFLVFVASCGVCAWVAHRSHKQSSELPFGSMDRTENPVTPRPWLWFALAASGSVMLLATTNLLTQDVAPVPLLWILPLAAYLLTFVLSFLRQSWYRRGIFHPLFAVTTLLVTIALFRGNQMSPAGQIPVFLGMLFVACMMCHGELARIKPSSEHLTQFYLTIAAGGAFGGFFVGIIAPQIFPAIWEYHIGLWFIAAITAAILFLDSDSWVNDPAPNLLIPGCFFTLLLLVPKYLSHLGMIAIPFPIASAYNILIIVAVLLLAGVAFAVPKAHARRLRSREIMVAVTLLMLSAILYLHLRSHQGRLLYRTRNFYGALSVLRIWDRDLLHSNIALMHGRITHGIQVESDRRLATTYYDQKSGAGLALTVNSRRHASNARVGVIGLGAGTVAAYARPSDVYRFYEINPAVIRLAQGEGGYFTFLKDSPAKIEIVSGDARLSLEREAANHDFQNFDVLIVDAFNGDSIPVHLLTREAMKLYLLHLRGPDSIIALHISNLAVDLTSPVASLAKLYRLKGTLIITSDDTGAIVPSAWILLTPGDSLKAPEIENVGKPMVVFSDATSPVWTDDYSNLIGLFNYRGFPITSLLTARPH